MTTRTDTALPADARAYLAELAADIAEHGPTGDMAADIAAAHARRMAFAEEMRAGTTDRARMARKVMAAVVWGRAVAAGAHERALDHCEGIAGETFRRSLYS